MKKELLIASALAGTVGLAGVAEAATASYSGHVRNGVLSKDTDGTADATWGISQQGSFSVSISETTDSGIKISTGLGLADEGTGSDADSSGLTLTFTDGSKLDVFEAGNAYATHLASVPSATGEQGVGGSTTINAPTGLTWANKSSKVGFEWHSAADAMNVEGLKFGISASAGDDGDATSTSSVETAYSIGASYVTTAGDSTVTIGGGFVNADDSAAKTINAAAESWAISATAATGDLTVGAGLSGGSAVHNKTHANQTEEIDGADVLTAGVKYVSGDITFAIGHVSGSGADTATFNGNPTADDAYTDTSASVSYTIASGVSGILGYSDRERDQDGTTSTDHSGTSWYIGALVSF
jgi:hypothetical protein